MITNTTTMAATAHPMAIVLPVPIVFEAGCPAFAVYGVSETGDVGGTSAPGVLPLGDGVGAGMGSGVGLLSIGLDESFCGAENESLLDEDESLVGVESDPESLSLINCP
jgi:hypothetical protein